MREYPGARTDLMCPDCGAPMVLLKQKQSRKRFYGCSRYPDCLGNHAAFENGAPQGVPADAHTRRLRVWAHEEFDKLWTGMDAHMSRNEAYRWMQQRMNMTAKRAHIGRFTADECERLIGLLRKRNGE